jgi:hypothetical protein
LTSWLTIVWITWSGRKSPALVFSGKVAAHSKLSASTPALDISRK